MFVNFSNHPLTQWDDRQLEVAKEAGEVETIPFPEVPADADEAQVGRLARNCIQKILEKKKVSDLAGEPFAVMAQGEYTLCYQVVAGLKEMGIKVLAACSAREKVIQTDENGEKVAFSRFRFTRFREYGGQ